MGKRKRETESRRRHQQASAEDVRRTLELAANPPPLIDRDTLGRLLRHWRGERFDAAARPLQTLDDILADPGRVAGFAPSGEVLERPVILVDKATGEIFEHRVRGIRVFNKMSAKGVEFEIIEPDAELWLRALVSGRKVKADGQIL